MTNQEAFDKVVVHLKQQKWKKALDGKDYMYRSGDGLKCAVGVLIPDSQYSTKLEDQDADIIMEHIPALSGLSSHMLLVLQKFHDSFMTSNESDNLDRLKDICEGYGLRWKHD